MSLVAAPPLDALPRQSGGGGTSGASFSFGTTAHTFADGNWHHAALVVDQSPNKTAQLYVDGVVQTVTERTSTCTTGTSVTSIDISGCGSLNATNSTDPFTVGDLLSGGVSTNPFIGSLDEVRVYNSALSSAQILSQYTADSTFVALSPKATSVYGQGGSFTTSTTGTTSSTFSTVRRVVLDSSGGFYTSEITNNRVLYFPSGNTTATRVYGQNATGTNYGSGTANLGGSITATTLDQPKGIALDSAGNLYVADNVNNRVLFYPISGGIAAVTPTRVYGQGTAGTVAASFLSGATGTSSSTISGPTALALDSSNNLYVAEAGNNRVLYFPSTGGVAGTADFTATRVYGQADFASGSANRGSTLTASTLSNPLSLKVDSSNNLYVSDSGNNRVVYYPTYTGNGMAATRVYGQADFVSGSANRGGAITALTLSSPYGTALDSSGDLYVADTLNNRVLYYPTYTGNGMAATRVYGQLGSFTTGTVNAPSGNSATPTATSLQAPVGLALNGSGNLYVADSLNNRILTFQTSLSVTTQPPASTVAGATFSMASSLIDVGSGGVFSDFTGAVSVGIKAGTGTGGAVLSGTTPVSAVNGVATFSNLSINLNGTGYILTTSSPGVGSADSAAFAIAILAPVGYWPLDDGSGTNVADLSGNNNPGTITGSTTWITTGKVNGALTFNGTTNYVSMGTPGTLKFGTGSFTVMTWFKTTSSVLGRMVGVGVSSFSTGFDLSTNLTSTCSAGCVGAELGGGTQGASVSFGSTATTFKDGNWHQAAMVINQAANTAQLYVDGVVQSLSLQGTTCGALVGGNSVDISLCNSANATNSGTDPFTLGAYHASSGAPSMQFAGSLDEVRVYNSALSSSQIQNQYALDTMSSPLGYWPFDEDSGATAHDSSSTPHNGTLTGGPGWVAGAINSGLSFNGSSNYVTMGTPAALSFGAGSFTIMNWFKTSDLTAFHRMISNGQYSWASGYFVGVGQTGCIGCVVGGVGAAGNQNNSLSFTTTAAFNDGNWHRTAMVIDRTANRAYIYVDGVAQNVTTYANTCGVVTGGTSVDISLCGNLNATPLTEAFTVGSHNGTDEWFNGSLDEVRVYGSALSSTQIQILYTNDTNALSEYAVATVSFSGTPGSTATFTLPVTFTYQLAPAPGWSISITSTTPTSGGNTLVTTSYITAVTATCTTINTCSGTGDSNTLTNTITSGNFPMAIPAGTIPPTPVKFFGTAIGTGTGIYTVTLSISVLIPATTRVGAYSSQITFVATPGP